MSKCEPLDRVSRNRPCPACGKPDWCLVSGDGRVCICSRLESGDRRGEAGWLHRMGRKCEGEFVPTKPKPDIDWRAEAEKYRAALAPEVRADLARSLGLPAGGLDCFPLLGMGGPRGDRFFTFPEVNGEGAVVGICRRFRAGKYQLPDGGRGLSVPHPFAPARAPVVFVVEGPTDVAAMWTAGLTAVGRPSNAAGGGDLACLLRHCPDGCRIVVVGENDQKEDFNWPGLHGAAVVADRLADSLQRRPGAQKFPVTWALCPDGAKDVREWLTGDWWTNTAWVARGVHLSRELLANAVPAEGADRSVRKLLARNAELERRLAAVEGQMREFLAGKK